MRFRSTRSENLAVDSPQALLAGLAPDGGLYVPEAVPRLDPELLSTPGLPYGDLAARVIGPWFDELPGARLGAAIEAALRRFDDPRVAPLVRAGELNILELFHGPTLAFKDLALTLFGALLTMAREAAGLADELLVVVATSGDTGSAALAGLEGVPGVRVVVLFPAEGISRVQRLQMTTCAAPNALVLGIDGNFDDAQRTAKALMTDPGLGLRLAARGLRTCSANSINVGRLVPQIAYYVHAYAGLVAKGLVGAGQDLDLAVPSGNFGNVLAARYAKAMGLPLGRFIVATNRNRVLADFLESGIYDRNRPFHVTSSPSMDILVSSNLERLLFEATGRDAARVAGLMGDLAERGHYELSPKEREAFGDFVGGSADETEAAATIKNVFEETGYLLDPHTATAVAVLAKLGRSGPSLVTATASPFKFAFTVAEAIGLRTDGGEGREDEFATLGRLAERANLPLPPQLEGLESRQVRHERVVAPRAVGAAIEAWVGGAR